MTEKSTGVLKANFHYPAAAGDNKTKTVDNTFLWDYYYKNADVHNQLDKNSDTYLEYRQYYNSERTYNNYPLLSAAMPYIIGLPGKTYYEFDLSGNFEAENTAVPITKIGKQILSFVSNKSEHIRVSDDEIKTAETTVTYSGQKYTFKPSYMNEMLTAGTNSYSLKPEFDSNNDGVTDCSVFDKVPASGEATAVSAFRPYFTGPADTPARQFVAQRIVFGSTDGEMYDGPESALGGLEIYVKDHRIITTSHLKEAVVISIVNVGGISLANYVLQPGETVETRVQNTGVYIVNKKKVFVK